MFSKRFYGAALMGAIVVPMTLQGCSEDNPLCCSEFKVGATIDAKIGGGAESLWEKQKREARDVRAEIEQDPFVRSVMSVFPGAEIVGVRNLAQPDASANPAPDDSDNDNDEDG